MAVIEVRAAACRVPGGEVLFHDVTFRVGDGEHVALIGANGAGKTTLFGALAGDVPLDEGTARVDGRMRVMRQLVGWRDETATVRDLLLSLSPAPLLRAASELSS